MGRVCSNCGAGVKDNAIMCPKCNTHLGTAIEESVAGPAGTREDLPGAGANYRYHTEFVSISEKFMGHTSSGSSASDITDRFNHLAERGWELVSMSPIPVVGKVFKSNEERTLTLAVWRKPA